jgi:perosamine synthetase
MDVLPVMRPWLGEDEKDAVAAVIESQWVAQGPRVAEFETAMAETGGAAAGVAVSSCTTGLHLALVAMGIGPGDDVIVPSLSFIATANVVVHAGARVVFADVDIVTQNLTVDTIKAVLTPWTRAVILVHQAGVPADIFAVRAFCAEHDVAVIEDAACAIGSTYLGGPIGGHSDAVVFSFHPRKVITTGEGGMVLTRDPDLGRRMRRLREHGMSVDAASRHASKVAVLEEYLEIGFNYRMTDVQAAIGLAQLGRLRAIIERRRYLGARYQALLADVPDLRAVTDPVHGTTNFQSMWVALDEPFPTSRNDLLAALLDAGISGRRGIMAAHLEPAYAGHEHGPLPVTEWLTANTVILPLFHQMTEADQDRVVEVVRRASVSRMRQRPVVVR